MVSFIQMQDFLQARGLTFFLVCLYIFEALLLAVLGVCLWVAWSVSPGSEGPEKLVLLGVLGACLQAHHGLLLGLG